MPINIEEELITYRNKTIEYENLLNSITDGFFSVDNDWNFSGMNIAFAKMCGKPKEELMGKNYWEFFPQSKYQKFYTEYNLAKEKMSERHFEEYSTRLKKWVAVSVYPATTALNVYFVDVTKQHNLREKLATNEYNIRSLINNTPDLIWSLDTELRIMYANSSFTDMVEQQVKSKISQGDKILMEAFGEERISIWNGYYSRALAGERFSIVIERGESSFETSFSPIIDANDKTIGLSCFSRDITERLRRIKEIEKQNERLQKIAWLYSHKVRKHVATILGLSQLIDQENYTNHDNKKVIEGIVASAKELDDVIVSIHKEE